MSLSHQLETLPTAPGVYLFKDERDAVLYVGKAKNLRARVRSYFRPAAELEPPKQDMIKRITSLDTIVVDTENEALVLEATLIRQHQPPYNVVLRDDKFYLFIKITHEDLPRVVLVRRIQQDGARYFGPYSSARSVRQTLKLLQRLFPFVGDTTPEHDWIFPHPLFTIGAATSADRTQEATRLSPDQYRANIEQVIQFLQGNRQPIMDTLNAGMKQAAQQKSYEQAALWRDQLQALERLEGAQKVYLPRPESFDVVSIATEAGRSAANVFLMRKGRLLAKNTFLLRHRQGTRLADVLRQFILQYYAAAQDIPQLIFVPAHLEDALALAQWINGTKPPTLTVPQRGVKRQLLQMGELNARQLLTEEHADFTHDQRIQRALLELAQALGLGTTALQRIETYDISNIQGQLATGSLVVFTDGKPDRAQYRKFRIRVTDTPVPRTGAEAPLPRGAANDFAMMQQVLARRFSGRHEEWRVPDLILIDGGKGQLSRAKAVLDALQVTAPVAALAKREEELFIAGRAEPIRLPYTADALYLVQRMRDEAHRTTLQYHQLLRSKRSSRSLLDEVPGIGPKTKKQLLQRFGSLKAIRVASLEELAAVVGAAKARLVQEYL